jgi:hypothetical protein
MLITSFELKTRWISRIKIVSSGSFDNYGLLISQLLTNEFYNAELGENREENLFLGAAVCQKSTSYSFIGKINNYSSTIPGFNFIALDSSIE